MMGTCAPYNRHLTPHNVRSAPPRADAVRGLAAHVELEPLGVVVRVEFESKV